MSRFLDDRVRVFRSIRTAHLERAHDLTPASILYSRTRNDFDPDIVRGLDLRRMSTPATVLALLRQPVSALEVTEPLARYGLWRACAAVLAVRAAGSIRGRRTVVGTYAIENRDVFEDAPTLVALARRRLERHAARWLLRHVDRVAFGTDGARETYGQIFGGAGAGHGSRHRVVVGLPAACTCPLEARSGDVLYLGGLIERKGFDRLAAAWPAVTSADVAAKLTIVGMGPLEPVAEALAEAFSGVTLVVDPPRAQIHTTLRRHRVLVLPSRRIPNYWREQIGLPILEALAHGLTVVTTSETGLAGWLAAHGHVVIAEDASPPALAAALLRARAQQRSGVDIVRDLPLVDGRLDADRWMFGDPSPHRIAAHHSVRKGLS